MTKVFNWQEKIKEEELDEVINCLKNDGIIIFPTDTVYGIGCNCFSKKGIKRIFELKNRDNNKPINVLTNSIDKIKLVANNINDLEINLINKYMPGALTVILDKKEEVPSILTADLDTIGVRIPKDRIALSILEKYDYPLATTSVNYSGELPGVKVFDFYNDFNGKVDYIIDGGVSTIGIASTIIRVENSRYKIIREGSIKIEDSLSE